MSDYPVSSMYHGLRFGPFALFPSRKLLLKDGNPVELGARAFDILAMLAARQGEVVGKQALMAEAWPDVFVDEVNLRVHISALRRALEDGQGGSRYLRTIPGRGYCFVAPVVHLGKPAPDPASPQDWLPRQAHTAIGRDELIASIAEDLARERLVTLTGPAGIGKTTVAIEVARRARASYGDGGAFVDLAPVNDAGALPAALAMALELSQLPVRTAEGVAAAISGRHLLLVVDNCEHLIEPVAEMLQVVLARTERVHILATSREPTGVTGEKVRRIEPLEVPDPELINTAADARANPAVQLFERRAKAARDSFELDDASAQIVADICRRLDGIPFAIDLTASRVDAFGLAELRAQLDHGMNLLDYSAARTAPRHQRSVRDALRWSYALLPPSEQMLLRRLSVFAGAFALEDAIALANVAGSSAVEITEQIARLVSKSLVAVEFRGLNARYRLLETTRVFAAEQLLRDDDRAFWRRRHASLVKARLEEAGDADRPQAAQYLDDLRAALDWAFDDAAEADTAATLTLAAVPLWTQLSLHSECRRRAELALRQAPDAPAERYRDVGLRIALGAAIMFSEGHGPAAVATLSEALDAARRLGDVEHELRALWGLYSCATNTGAFHRALQLAEQFADAARASPLQDDQLVAERMLGAAYYFIGEPTLARLHLEAFLDRYIPPPDGRDIRRYHLEQRISAQVLLAAALWHLGLPDQARALSDRYLGDATSLDHPLTLVYATAHHAFQCTILYRDVEVARADLRRLGEFAKRTPAALQYLALLSATLEAGLGDAGAGVERLEAAVKRQAATGLAPGFTNALGYLAIGWARLGDTPRALAAVGWGLQRSEQTGELWCHGELTRIKGDILLEAGELERATALLECAVQEARERGRLGWELRAAISLARAWKQLRKPDAARELLSDVSSRFSEGFAARDLIAARGLLRTLS